MRGAILTSLMAAFLFGCGANPSGNKGGGSAEKKTPRKSALPVTQRMSAGDLNTYYLNAPHKVHPLTGKRVLLKIITNNTFMSEDGDGKPCVQYDSNGGFARPRILVRLGDGAFYEKGKSLAPTDLLEADFKGLVDTEGRSWAKLWVNMKGNSILPPNTIILFENGEIVSSPE